MRACTQRGHASRKSARLSTLLATVQTYRSCGCKAVAMESACNVRHKQLHNLFSDFYTFTQPGHTRATRLNATQQTQLQSSTTTVAVVPMLVTVLHNSEHQALYYNQPASRLDLATRDPSTSAADTALHTGTRRWSRYEARTHTHPHTTIARLQESPKLDYLRRRFNLKTNCAHGGGACAVLLVPPLTNAAAGHTTSRSTVASRHARSCGRLVAPQHG
jgi:hypothetical protein